MAEIEIGEAGWAGGERKEVRLGQVLIKDEAVREDFERNGGTSGACKTWLTWNRRFDG